MKMFGHRDSNDSNETADSHEKLLQNSDDGQWPPAGSCRRSHSRKYFLLGHSVVEILLISLIAYLAFKPTPKSQCRQILYTPAADAISFKSLKFNAGYLDGERSIYQLEGPAPTNETDRVWSELYGPWMWSRIPREQAARLTNLTINIPGAEDQYLVGLDVFHQLHCLDNVRKGLWPERYKPEDHMGGKGMSLLSHQHLDHCIDQIRQSLMCGADLSTNWLFWDEEAQTNTASGSTFHSCRDFERIVDWAREHKQEPFDLKIRLEDPLKKELAKG